MRYVITEMFDGKWWVTSHKAHLGWSTLDGVYATQEEAEADCDKAGGGYHVRHWTDSGWFEPAHMAVDEEPGSKTYREKELDYDYGG